jgi:hypothetical protein
VSVGGYDYWCRVALLIADQRDAIAVRAGHDAAFFDMGSAGRFRFRRFYGPNSYHKALRDRMRRP